MQLQINTNEERTDEVEFGEKALTSHYEVRYGRHHNKCQNQLRTGPPRAISGPPARADRLKIYTLDLY